jgi:uncharacterized protein YjiS (DUF1127 family)
MSRIYSASLPRVSAKPFLQSLTDVVLLWQERARQRHMLASLDERMLRDVGLSRAEVSAETMKPFWHR